MSNPPRYTRPGIRLAGNINDDMLSDFLGQFEAALDRDLPLVTELFTLGGDADVARRIALELKLCREAGERDMYFVGKTAVYSAGVTIMSAFKREQRFLTRDCILLIHGREIDYSVRLSGPLGSNVRVAESVLAQLQNGLALEREGFADLADGADITVDEVSERAAGSWYLTAAEALEYRLIAGIL